MRSFNITTLFFMAVVLTLGFTSCKDKEVEGLQTWNLTSAAPFVVSNYVAPGLSPDSTYGLSFVAQLNGGNNMTVKGLTPTVFYAALIANQQNGLLTSKVSIADFGKSKSLADVTSIPNDGAFKESVSLEMEHGYVMKVQATFDLGQYAEHHPGLRTPSTLFVRIWVEEELDGGGFKISYQYPFVP